MNAVDQEIIAVSQEIGQLKARLSELRRQAKPVVVQEYTFETTNGSASLAQCFGEQDDLLVIHNMGQECAYCTMWADGFVGVFPYLQSRSAVVLINHHSPVEQQQFAQQRGWPFPLASARNTSFTEDMGFTYEKSMMPGVSAFHREPDGTIQRTGSAFFGPGDDFCAPWPLFDLLKGGVGEWEPGLVAAEAPGQD